MGLEPNRKLPQPLGILEEIFQEKKILKIIFKRLRYINFSKKLSKKSDPLDKVACRSTVQTGAEFFLGFFILPIIWPSIGAFFSEAPHCTEPQAMKEVRCLRSK